jgi:hypothetical protein
MPPFHFHFGVARGIRMAFKTAAAIPYIPVPRASAGRRGATPADCVLLFGDRVPDSSDELLVEAPALRDLHEPGTPALASLQAVMHEAGISGRDKSANSDWLRQAFRRRRYVERERPAGRRPGREGIRRGTWGRSTDRYGCCCLWQILLAGLSLCGG